MSDFKAGDKVVCVDRGAAGLTFGQEYSVAYRSKYFVYLEGFEDGDGYYPERFKLVEPKTTSKESYLFACQFESNGKKLYVHSHKRTREEALKQVNKAYDMLEGI